MSDFVSADIGQISRFEADSAEVITEFKAIRDQFDAINATLLGKWSGAGADGYRGEAEHILENIGGIKDILDSVNNGIVKDIKEQYLLMDEALAEFNRNPTSGENNRQ